MSCPGTVNMYRLLLLAFCGLAAAWDWDEVREIDTYMAEPEPSFGYTLLYTDTVNGATVYTFNFTSLVWYDETLTTTPQWWHWLSIVIPDQLTYDDVALLLCGAGNKNDGKPSLISGNVAELIDFSVDTGAISATVEGIPNQPMVFVDDELGEPSRSEDEIIGYTWRLFIQQDYTEAKIIANLPMTKAAKLAMDVVVEFAPTVRPGVAITKYMATGYSKRGWVAWMLGHTDPRVFAIAPVVFDLLNFYDNLVHHYMSLGGWSWAFKPYHDCEITRNIHNPRTQIIGSHIDSLEYVERMTMPKLLMGATGDQFFLPDGTHYWWDEMIGENHYQLFENDDHILATHTNRIWLNIKSFFVAVKEGIPRPDYSFTKSQDLNSGTITVIANTQPTWVRAWVADNTERVCPDDDTSATCRRDFRLARADIPTNTLIEWTATMLDDQGGGLYSHTVPMRTDYGKTIFHIEMAFPGPGNRDYHFTTQSHIVEDTMPFANCSTLVECHGQLV